MSPPRPCSHCGYPSPLGSDLCINCCYCPWNSCGYSLCGFPPWPPHWPIPLKDEREERQDRLEIDSDDEGFPSYKAGSGSGSDAENGSPNWEQHLSDKAGAKSKAEEQFRNDQERCRRQEAAHQRSMREEEEAIQLQYRHRLHPGAVQEYHQRVRISQGHPQQPLLSKVQEHRGQPQPRSLEPQKDVPLRRQPANNTGLLSALNAAAGSPSANPEQSSKRKKSQS